jgi:hypothetical protein
MEAQSGNRHTRSFPTMKQVIDAEKHGSRIGPIHTVQTFAASEPALNEGGIRWMIFRHKDALLEAGAIFYSGKKLLIDRDLYIDFLKEGRAA